MRILHITSNEELRPVDHRAVFPYFKAISDKAQHCGMDRHEPDLVTFAFDAEVHDALAASYVPQP